MDDENQGERLAVMCKTYWAMSTYLLNLIQIRDYSRMNASVKIEIIY